MADVGDAEFASICINFASPNCQIAAETAYDVKNDGQGYGGLKYFFIGLGNTGPKKFF